jgi:hypothetical protein
MTSARRIVVPPQPSTKVPFEDQPRTGAGPAAPATVAADSDEQLRRPGFAVPCTREVRPAFAAPGEGDTW